MIGYYVHHHGRGHAERAAQLSRALGEPVVGLSSLPAPSGETPFADWLELERDDTDRDSAVGHAAGGALHWAPLRCAGYAARMQRIAHWLAGARPRLVVVDVSVEVTVLCRTLGFPVVAVAGAGERPDAPHALAYRLAEAVVAPWPGRLYRPRHLDELRDKVHYVGAISRFDGRDAGTPPHPGSVLVLFGAGGGSVGTADIDQARKATPGTTWAAYGVPGTPWCADVWSALCAAEVVVTHAGQNALAEIAAARRPAVIIPQQRPFDEQRATAAVLAQHRLATVRDRWPSPQEWPDTLAAARCLGGTAWSAWNDGHGADRAAAVLEEVLARA